MNFHPSVSAIVRRDVDAGGPSVDDGLSVPPSVATAPPVPGPWPPVPVTLPSYPFKIPNPVKVRRRSPDMAELLNLQRLIELSHAISLVHEPGATMHVISDGMIYGPLFGVSDHEARCYRADAEQMITDHTKTSNELKSMVSSGDVKADVPKDLDKSSQDKLDKLRNAKASDFAGDYDPMQVSAPKDAVSLFERYAKSCDNAKLKDWAGKTLPALRHHLEMAENLDKNHRD